MVSTELSHPSPELSSTEYQDIQFSTDLSKSVPKCPGTEMSRTRWSLATILTHIWCLTWLTEIAVPQESEIISIGSLCKITSKSEDRWTMAIVYSCCPAPRIAQIDIVFWHICFHLLCFQTTFLFAYFVSMQFFHDDTSS